MNDSISVDTAYGTVNNLEPLNLMFKESSLFVRQSYSEPVKALYLDINGLRYDLNDSFTTKALIKLHTKALISADMQEYGRFVNDYFPEFRNREIDYAKTR